MMHELNRFEQYIESKINILTSLRSEVDNEKLYQSQQLNEVGKLLENDQIEYKERKMSIVNIGNQTEYRFKSKKAKIESVLSDKVKNECNVNYAFEVDDKSFKKCMKYLHKFGALKCGDFGGECDYVKTTMNETQTQTTQTINMNNKQSLANLASLREEIQQNTEYTEEEKRRMAHSLNMQIIRTGCNQAQGIYEECGRWADERNKLMSTINALKEEREVLRHKLNENDQSDHSANDKLLIAALRKQIEKNEKEYLQKVNCSNADKESKSSQIEAVMEECNRLMKKHNESMSTINDLRHKLNENEQIAENYTKLKGQMFAKNQCIAATRKKMQAKRDKIEELEKMLHAKDEQLEQLKEELAAETKEGECWEEIEKWSKENDTLRDMIKHLNNTTKAHKIQINALQKKVKNQSDEIKKLRIETNQQRKQQNVKMNAIKTSGQSKKQHIKMNKLEPKKVSNNNEKPEYALKARLNQIKKYQPIIRKLNKMMNVNKDSNIGREYVETFCKLAKINQPKVQTRIVTKAKNKQEWQCVIIIQTMDIVVTERSNSSKKQMAINICYQRLANRICRGQI